jgi:hypothetical protein
MYDDEARMGVAYDIHDAPTIERPAIERPSAAEPRPGDEQDRPTRTTSVRRRFIRTVTPVEPMC